MRLRFEKRKAAPAWFKVALPVAAVTLTFVLSAALILLARVNPAVAYFRMFEGALGSWLGITETLVKAAPLILTGLAVAIAFKGRFYNIGVEGQLYAGALGATWIGMQLSALPAALAVPIVTVAAMLFGALWALVAAVLKVQLRADDVVCTLLLNYVMTLLVGALVNGPWRDPVTNWPQSPDLPESALYTVLLPESRVHLGVALTVVAVVLVAYLLHRTTLGLAIKAVGLNERAAAFFGIAPGRTIVIVALISGGLAGLAGAGELLGLHGHLIETLSPGYGFTGIIVAMLGALNPLGIVFSAVFVSVVITGAGAMSRYTGVPSYISGVMQGLALISILAMFLLNHYRIRVEWRRRPAQPPPRLAEESPHAQP
jgi:simple sugar transport system permease protein